MEFITKDFLLNGDTARALYHEAAAGLPIIDYHCHIQASHIADNVSFDNLTSGSGSRMITTMDGSALERGAGAPDYGGRERLREISRLRQDAS